MSGSPDNTGKSGDPFYYRHRTFFVGLFIAVPLVLVPVLLVYTLVRSEIFESWRYLYVRCESGTGLKQGSSVNVRGIRVGHAREVSLSDDGFVYVKVRVKRRYAHFVHKDSRARLKQKNFVVGDWEIDLAMGSEGSPPVADGDTLVADLPLRIDMTMEQVTRMVAMLEPILTDIQQGKGVLGLLLQDDSLANILGGLAGRVDGLLTSVDRTVDRANAMIDKVSDFGAHGVAAADSIGALSRDIVTLVGNVDSLVADIHDVASGLGDLPADIKRITELVERDLREAEILLKALQKHWLFRRSVRKQRRLKEQK